MRSGRHRGQPTRHGSRRPRRTSVRHPCRTRLRRHVLVLVVLGRQRAEGARAGRFPALSISHAVNLRGQQAKHNGPLAQLGVACTSNQPTQTAKPKTPTAQRRGGRGKRTSCSTAGSGGRKLRGSFVLGARSGGGYYSLRDSGGVRWISAQLRDGKTTRGRPAWPTTRRTVAWTSRRRPYHIGQCSVLGCLGAARAPCLSYLGSSSASSAPRCRPDRRGFRATLLLPGTGTGQTDVHAQPCVAGLVRPNVGARFLRSKRRAGGGGVQCSAAAGRTIRTALDDTRCVTSVPPTTLWTVVVDVPVLFRAGFPALLRAAEYNPRLVFFLSLRLGRGRTTVMHARA